MTVLELRDRLDKIIKAGKGSAPVARWDDGAAIVSAGVGGSAFMQAVCYLKSKDDS